MFEKIVSGVTRVNETTVAVEFNKDYLNSFGSEIEVAMWFSCENNTGIYNITHNATFYQYDPMVGADSMAAVRGLLSKEPGYTNHLIINAPTRPDVLTIIFRNRFYPGGPMSAAERYDFHLE